METVLSYPIRMAMEGQRIGGVIKMAMEDQRIGGAVLMVLYWMLAIAAI